MADSDYPNDSIPLLRGDRPLPHNTAAEIAVIGSILLDPSSTLDVASAALDFRGSFYNPAHREIFDVLLEMGRQGRGDTIDLVTLEDELTRRNKLEEVGGRAYLSRLMNSVATAANIEHYIEIVHGNAVLRRLIGNSVDVLERCYAPDKPVKELLDDIEQEITEISRLRQSHDLTCVSDAVYDAVTYIEKLQSHDPSIMGLQTGFHDLDQIILGLKGGEMFVLAARPSIGKTAMALNMAEHIALRGQEAAVGIFSLEMNTRQLVLRLLCSLARINLADIRDCSVSRGRWTEVMERSQELRQAPIYIDDASASLDIVELRARARYMKQQHDIQVLFVDYLQLIKPAGGNRNTTRENEVARISGGLKGLAKELDIPIVVLAQLNRQAEQTGQRPRLAHLRESGAIEQDADIVALLHRERDVDAVAPGQENQGIESELIIAKHRNGRTGIAHMLFFPMYTRFENASGITDEDIPDVD